jgi:adenylate kinase family enzyme
MATGIMILGESGSGKSTSIENLNPKETFIVQAVNKPLPFKGFKNNYHLRTKENIKGNRYVADDTNMIIKLLKTLNKDEKIKYIVLDDVQYTIINSFMRDIKEKKTGESYASKKSMMKHEKGESKKMKMKEGEMPMKMFKKGGKKC